VRLFFQCRKQLTAAGLTVAARFHADTAVLVHVFMLLARVATGLAGRRARLELRPQDSRIRLGLSSYKVSGCGADIGAVQIAASASTKQAERCLAAVSGCYDHLLRCPQTMPQGSPASR